MCREDYAIPLAYEGGAMRRIAVMSVLCVLALGITLTAKEKANSSPLVGTWKCTAQGGPNGDIPFTLYLEQSTQGLTGTVSAPQGDADLTSVTFKDNHLKIDIDAEENNYTLTGTFTDGKLAGTWYRDGEKQGAWKGTK